MKDLRTLEKELSKYESELQSITKNIQKDTPFPLHALDGHSESYSYDVYLDPERAKFLNNQIQSLKSQISSYSIDVENARRQQEKVELERREWREETITHTAQVLYEQKMDTYMEMNFWGKAKALFSGKKPKKMNQQEIIETFGKQAVKQITSPGIEEIMRQKQAQLESVKITYANDPKMLEYAIRATEQYFDSQLSNLQATYDKTLSDVKGDKSR